MYVYSISQSVQLTAAAAAPELYYSIPSQCSRKAIDVCTTTSSSTRRRRPSSATLTATTSSRPQPEAGERIPAKQRKLVQLKQPPNKKCCSSVARNGLIKTQKLLYWVFLFSGIFRQVRWPFSVILARPYWITPKQAAAAIGVKRRPRPRLRRARE